MRKEKQEKDLFELYPELQDKLNSVRALVKRLGLLGKVNAA